MDLSKISNITQLKALAYDLVQAIDVQQSNLRIVQERIAEVQREQEAEQQQVPTPSEKKK